MDTLEIYCDPTLLFFFFFFFSDSTHLLNNSSFHTGLKFSVHWILQELGSVSGISVLIHGSATATLWRHSWRELFLSWLSPASPATPPQASFSGPSSTPLLLMPSPPALSWCIFPSISQADLIQHHGLNISGTLKAYGLFLWPRPLSWLDVAGCPCSLYLEA